jgi:NADH-quinone oxidoreductase subunit G
MLNMNRCIQCTRCVRFTEEISKTGEIGFFNRGAHAEIGVFPGKPLDNRCRPTSSTSARSAP